MEKKLINKKRYRSAMTYCIKREVKSKPNSTARKFWLNLQKGIRQKYTFYLEGETI